MALGQTTAAAPFEDGFASTSTRRETSYRTVPLAPFSPLMLQIALHYWMRSDADYAADDPRHAMSAPAQACIRHLLDAGLLVERTAGPANSPRYEHTDGLRVWLGRMLSTPMPVKRTVEQWAFPNEESSQ